LVFISQHILYKVIQKYLRKKPIDENTISMLSLPRVVFVPFYDKYKIDQFVEDKVNNILLFLLEDPLLWTVSFLYVDLGDIVQVFRFYLIQLMLSFVAGPGPFAGASFSSPDP